MEFQKKLIPWREALILLAIFHVPLIAQSRPNYIDSFTHSIQSYEKIWVNVGGKLALCTGNEKGNIVLEVGGGKPPYSFRWNTNETTQNRANLNAGTYTVWITDSEGSIHREAIVIQPPFPLILNPLVKIDASCGSANNGYAKIGVKIGRNDYEKDIPPYKVTWSNGLKDVWEANNLAPGTYTVKVADKFNCEASVSFEIKSANRGISVHERITHVSCIGQNQGEINLNVSGGEAPYSYLWSNGFKGKDLKGVEEGIYQVLITDASNCTFQGSYMVQASGEIQLGEKIEMPTCNSSENGGIELAISGGRPPYTIRWGDNSVQQTLHNLGEGDYQVKITDALGCSLEKVFALKAQSQLKVSILKVDQVSCFGGMDGAIALGISGAKGKLKIIWEDDAVAGLERRNLKAGIYKVQISDDFDCPISREIELKETEQLMAKIESVVEKNCDSGDLVGRAWVIVTGGKGPYSFHWLDSGLKATEIQFRQSGSLKVKIMDAVGCTAEVQTQVVFPNLDSREEDSLAFEVRKLAINSEPQIRVGDELIFEPQFLTKFISWEWDFGDGQKSSQKSPSYRYGKSGFFEVQLLAKDSYGCTSIQKAQVLVQSNELLLIPNAFSPNGDQLNDFFVPRMSGFKEVKIQIFNIWGELLYTQTHLDGPGWDGTYSGQIAPVGNYIYKLDYINQEGIKKSSTGTIALIR